MDTTSLLKAKLQIKRELKYVTAQLEKSKIEFPQNKAAHNYWEGMQAAYQIALDHIEGREV